MFHPLSSAALLGLSLAAAPLIAHADPHVISGIGPSSTQSPAQPQYYNDPSYQTPAPAAASSSGNLGGGFLEMLVTGHNPPPQNPYMRAPRSMNEPSAPGSQMTAYADPQAAVPRQEIDPIYRRQDVAYSGNEHPGTIVIDTPNKFLFYVEPGGHALRYGIGVGRPGFAWAGVKTISRKAEWPGWTPPAEMLLRRPDLPAHMEGGPANPLGARALYLGSSLYRIHGTNEPMTIGTNVSSGCIRMMNEDVEDLYTRVRVGTKVIVM
jgi:lipoprotein-anchoring transpeptidase ErfK/SrfK